MNTFLKQTPDTEVILLGIASGLREGVTRAMKKCAPLTSRDWDIIIEVSASTCRFGIFRSSSAPTSLSLESTYFDGQTKGLPAAIQASCELPSVVTFRSDCGKSLTICFTHNEISEDDLVSPSELLSSAILAKLSDNALKEAARAYLVKMLDFALKGSHGSLICVVDASWDKGKLPKMLSDGIILDPSIDIGRAISRMRDANGGTSPTYAAMSYFELIKGMVTFDGITVFSNDGRLLAYNVFVSAPAPAKHRRDEIQGARKRAFSVLESKLGDPIVAAFYQSQDGKTIFKTYE